MKNWKHLWLTATFVTSLVFGAPAFARDPFDFSAPKRGGSIPTQSQTENTVTPVLAVVHSCEASLDSIGNLVEPVQNFANGAIRVAHISTEEPAAVSEHLLIFIRVKEGIGDDCFAVRASHETGYWGFYSLDFTKVRVSYNDQKGLLLRIPARVYDSDTADGKPSPPREPSARCSVKKRGDGKSANLQSRPRLLRRQQPTPRERPPMRHRAKRPNRQNEMRCWRLNRRRSAMPVTRHGRQQRKSGGVATKPEARRIAANIAKLPDLPKRPQY